MLPKSEFGRNVLKLMTGTAFAQALPIAIAPVLTRLYTPEEFGVYYVFAALVALLSVVGTGRYEWAILIPGEAREAMHVALAGGLACTGFSLVLAVPILLAGASIALWLGEPAIGPWLWTIPVSVFLQGWYNVLHLWHNRNKRFGVLTANQFLVGGGNAVARTGFGFGFAGVAGLVWGTLLAWAVGLGAYIWQVVRWEGRVWQGFSRAELRRQAYRFRHFPGRLLFGTLFNKATFEIPPILINLFYQAAAAGNFGQMQAVIRRPLQMIGRAFEEVFKQRASEEIREFGHCKYIFFKTLKKLSLVGAFPFILFFFAAPWLFAWVFGEPWRTAGEYARLFTLPFYLQFVVSPLSVIIYLQEHTTLYSVVEGVQLLLILAAMGLGQLLFEDAYPTLILLAATYTLGYAIRLFILLALVKGHAHEKSSVHRI